MSLKRVLIAAAALAMAPGAIGGSGKTQGVATSKIIIELFSDFQCPACKSLHEGTIRPLVSAYVNTGKVFLIHRDFPLPMHQYARPAASLAAAAARVGKYDEVADTLFEKQELWSKTGKVEEAVMAVLTPAEAKKV